MHAGPLQGERQRVDLKKRVRRARVVSPDSVGRSVLRVRGRARGGWGGVGGGRQGGSRVPGASVVSAASGTLLGLRNSFTVSAWRRRATPVAVYEKPRAPLQIAVHWPAWYLIRWTFQPARVGGSRQIPGCDTMSSAPSKRASGSLKRRKPGNKGSAFKRSNASTNPHRRAPSKASGNRKKGTNLRDKSTINRINMYRGGTKVRDKKGRILHGGAYADRHQVGGRDIDRSVGRTKPNRKWFGNTRVIGQAQLDKFREEVTAQVHDPYQVILRQSKVPMGLISDAASRTGSGRNATSCRPTWPPASRRRSLEVAHRARGPPRRSARGAQGCSHESPLDIFLQ